MKVEASAPSNIALIKYMGKTAGQPSGNLPTNASLSYALEHLRSFVTIESGDGQDEWRPLHGLPELKLSDAGRHKFLAHFQRLKAHWGIEGFFQVASANNFPSDGGLASSASSFAALTLATGLLAKKLGRAVDEDRGALSRLSRLGSGSSARSFFSPWALWRGEGAEGLDLGLRLEHVVLGAEGERKAVSSSEAHRRVLSSGLFPGRPARAENRLCELLAALRGEDWRRACDLCWNEFWDMHALFETSQPPFGYMNAQTLEILGHIREIWRSQGDGPLVTMDAGSAVHVFLRPDQTGAAETWFHGRRWLKSWS